MTHDIQYASACVGICSLVVLSLSGSAIADAANSITVDNFTFKPATITVRAGTTVVFTNADDIPHSVVATDGSFRSKALDTNDTFSFTFQRPGSFAYFCGLHPHMQGNVVVTP